MGCRVVREGWPFLHVGAPKHPPLLAKILSNDRSSLPSSSFLKKQILEIVPSYLFHSYYHSNPLSVETVETFIEKKKKKFSLGEFIMQHDNTLTARVPYPYLFIRANFLGVESPIRLSCCAWGQIDAVAWKKEKKYIIETAARTNRIIASIFRGSNY